MDAFFACIFYGFLLPHILIHDLSLAFNGEGPCAFGSIPSISFQIELQ